MAGEGYSMGVAVADYDNDGHPDIFVAGVNRNILYHNRGDGTFEDVTAKAHLGGVDAHYGKLWSVAAAWVDIDNDGWLDLVVSNYVQWDPKLRTHLRHGRKAGSTAIPRPITTRRPSSS